MEPKTPTVKCNRPSCFSPPQPYTGQKECNFCHKRLNDWSVASQLATQGQAQQAHIEN